MTRISKIVGRGTAVAVAVGIGASSAIAGGFAIREQSAEFQGMSFAGAAAGGGGLSGMFWNPAVVGQFNGIWTESHASYILPDSQLTALPGSTLYAVPNLSHESGNIGKDALVPASYASVQISKDMVLGLSINSAFGLVTEPQNAWDGQTQARTSSIFSINFAPTLAYRITPSVTVAAGLQVEYIHATLKQASGGSPTAPSAVVDGTDTAVGFTLGATWQPTASTSVGVGFRSSIEHKLEGETFLSAGGFGPGGLLSAPISAALKTPEIVTVGIRQAVAPNLTLLGGVEWTNWSRLDKLDVVCTGNSIGANNLGCPTANGAGTLQSSLPLGWHDGWFFSGGAEYNVNDKLTVRAGGAYEISPVTSAAERSPRVPDNDRIWASLGGTYKWSETMAFDLAYTHIWVDEGAIDRTQSGVRLVATADSSVDIFSVSLKMKLGENSALPK